MVEENISEEFRWKKNRWNKKLFHWKNEAKSTKRVCTTLSYINHFLILASAITGYIPISAFGLGIPIGITSSAIGLKTCAIAAGIQSINK